MKCQKCGTNEANFRYAQVINGVKNEIILCDSCSKKIGINNLEFYLPLNFSNFFNEVLNENEDNIIPSFNVPKPLKCSNCGMTYNEFANEGKFGCSICYDSFGGKIEQLLKKIHGEFNHIGKKLLIESIYENTEIEVKENEKIDDNKLEDLKERLNKAIKNEKYEDAAIIRDEIKELEG